MIPEAPTHMTFWEKLLELQITMLITNQENVQNHNYASDPTEWPFLTRGIAYFISKESNVRERAFPILTLVTFWDRLNTKRFIIYLTCCCPSSGPSAFDGEHNRLVLGLSEHPRLLFSAGSLLVATETTVFRHPRRYSCDLVRVAIGDLIFYIKRERYDLNSGDAVLLDAWEEFANVGQVLLGGYLFHYLPFFFCDRTLFIHHYLTAYSFKIMLTSFLLHHFHRILR